MRPRIGWKPFSYDRGVASVRLRVGIPAERLGGAGFDTGLVPADGSGDYDAVVFQKAYEQADLELARRLQARGIPVVFDLCDNHLYNPTGNARLAERATRIQTMLELADLVTVSTPTLADIVRAETGIAADFVIEDAIELPPVSSRARRRGRRRAEDRAQGVRPVRLVWFGNSGAENPPFGLVHLAEIVPELERVHETERVELTVISNDRDRFRRAVAGASFDTRFVRWRADRFADALARNDICVLPIGANPFTLCKTSNRVVIALMLGLPVIAGEIPSYREFAPWIRFGGWVEHITEYARAPERGVADVAGARQHIERTYTDERLVAQWSEALRAALGGGPPRPERLP